MLISTEFPIRIPPCIWYTALGTRNLWNCFGNDFELGSVSFLGVFWGGVEIVNCNKLNDWIS